MNRQERIAIGEMARLKQIWLERRPFLDCYKASSWQVNSVELEAVTFKVNNAEINDNELMIVCWRDSLEVKAFDLEGMNKPVELILKGDTGLAAHIFSLGAEEFNNHYHYNVENEEVE